MRTCPGRSGSMACTPLGAERMSSRARRLSSAERARQDPPPVWARAQDAPGSSPARACRKALSRSPLSAPPAGRRTRASAWPGMALSCSPPWREMSRTPGRLVRHWASTRLALGMFLWISAPEWPPGRPDTERVKTSPEAASAGRGMCRSHRAPPAQPTVRIPSASESMFSRYLLLRSEQSRAVAPSRPISSSTVNTASRGGWGMASLSSTAMAMATAMPSSPPRVVPRALIQSPSTTSSRPSLVKSWSTPASATHTMSRWPWSITAGWSS